MAEPKGERGLTVALHGRLVVSVHDTNDAEANTASEKPPSERLAITPILTVPLHRGGGLAGRLMSLALASFFLIHKEKYNQQSEDLVQ